MTCAISCKDSNTNTITTEWEKGSKLMWKIKDMTGQFQSAYELAAKFENDSAIMNLLEIKVCSFRNGIEISICLFMSYMNEK